MKTRTAFLFFNLNLYMHRSQTVLTLLFIILLIAGCKPVQKLGISDPIFPDHYSGIWQGELKIYSYNKVLQKLPMELAIGPDILGNFDWIITYGQGDDASVRSYTLRKKDPSIGHYEIDENNGINLQADLNNNQLVSIYEVQNNLISVTYSFYNDHIDFNIIVTRPDPIDITGNTIYKGDSIPVVNVHPLVVTQSARLTKVK